MQLMQYFTHMFFSILVSNRIYEPNVTDLCRLSEAILLTEDESQRGDDWKNRMKTVQKLYDETHPNVKTHLAIIEVGYYKNMQLSAAKKVEIQDNDGEIREYYTHELYKYLDLAGQTLVRVVVGVAKKYSLEIPYSGGMMKKTTELN